MKKCMVVLLLIVALVRVHAQDQPVDNKSKNAVIDSVAKVLRQYYVLPEKGKAIADYLGQQQKKGAYKELKTYSAFLTQLNKDIQSVHRDLHLNVSYNPEKAQLVRKAQSALPDSAIYQQRALRSRYFNFGIAKAERLAGNVAYIDIREFPVVTEASKRAVDAALNMNQSPSALIIDLREHNGGSIDMGRYISSYLFGDSVHLSDVSNRMTGTTVSYWTNPSGVSRHLVHTPVYVLISGSTFSAGEEFAYSLQKQGRAVIIGERSAGGAHGFGSKAVNDVVVIGIPYERIENALTKDNWEGTGITPDSSISSPKALLKAHLMALNSLKPLIDDDESRQEIGWRRDYLQAIIYPVPLNQSQIKDYAGVYGTREVVLINEALYLQRKDGTQFRMIPINDHVFYLNELNYRLEFVPKAGGKYLLYMLFEDGYRQESA